MDVVIIANAWAAARDNPTSKHQSALELARQGHRVLWMEGAGMRRPSLNSASDRGRIQRKVTAALRGVLRVWPEDMPDVGRRSAGTVGAIWVLTPLTIPFPASRSIRRFNGWLYRICARRWADRLRFQSPVLINYVPVLAQAMRGWGKACRSVEKSDSPPSNRHATGTGKVPKAVYHCVDKWDEFNMYDAGMMKEADEACCRYADLVIASSRDLLEHCSRKHHNVHLVNHGVDHDHFSRPLGRTGGECDSVPERPGDLPGGPVIGFFGLLSEWVDQDLLLFMARRMRQCNVILIGAADVPVDRLRGEENIHILGPKPFADLPAYTACFDVGIIPFVVNDLTRAVNPVKLREMLAAGCPVVSTNLPEVTAYVGDDDSPHAVSVAGDRETFADLVRERIEHALSRDERRAISESMKGETWAAKVAQIVELLHAGVPVVA